MRQIYLFIVLLVLSVSVFSQGSPPAPKSYPVAVRDRYSGKPVSPKLITKRARTFRTMIREGSKQGPNFAGRYTIITWGAGLGTFSMAVVDAKTGIVFFPPFKSVYGSGYGLPFLDDGSNPTWSNDSRLFAFFGRPDVGDKGMGLYVYSFDKGRFKLRYFEKEDEEKRKTAQANWEKELDRRMNSMAKIYEELTKQLSESKDSSWCHGRPSHRYPWPGYEIICTEDEMIVSINVNYHTTPEDAGEMLKSNVKGTSFANFHAVDGLGDQGFDADQCSRAWIRFQKGTYYVWANANLNKEETNDPNCSNESNSDSKRLREFSKRLAFILADSL